MTPLTCSPRERRPAARTPRPRLHHGLPRRLARATRPGARCSAAATAPSGAHRARKVGQHGASQTGRDVAPPPRTRRRPRVAPDDHTLRTPSLRRPRTTPRRQHRHDQVGDVALRRQTHLLLRPASARGPAAGRADQVHRSVLQPLERGTGDGGLGDVWSMPSRTRASTTAPPVSWSSMAKRVPAPDRRPGLPPRGDDRDEERSPRLLQREDAPGDRLAIAEGGGEHDHVVAGERRGERSAVSVPRPGASPPARHNTAPRSAAPRPAVVARAGRPGRPVRARGGCRGAVDPPVEPDLVLRLPEGRRRIAHRDRLAPAARSADTAARRRARRHRPSCRTPRAPRRRSRVTPPAGRRRAPRRGRVPDAR